MEGTPRKNGDPGVKGIGPRTPISATFRTPSRMAVSSLSSRAASALPPCTRWRLGGPSGFCPLAMGADSIGGCSFIPIMSLGCFRHCEEGEKSAQDWSSSISHRKHTLVSCAFLGAGLACNPPWVGSKWSKHRFLCTEVVSPFLSCQQVSLATEQHIEVYLDITPRRTAFRCRLSTSPMRPQTTLKEDDVFCFAGDLRMRFLQVRGGNLAGKPSLELAVRIIAGAGFGL